ncbi:MAG TPA: hypothetical protein VMH49_02805 [Thermoplasmata archaeon]|nr:hypothetical protein [Thermoplasmata archaeon]
MSDTPAGWFELLVRPLGERAPEDVPLGVLPCLGTAPGPTRALAAGSERP